MKIVLHKRLTRGSVLVVALLLLVAGTIGMASMTGLLSTRSRAVMNSEIGVQRRMALRNARALCQHFFMRGAIANASSAGQS